MADKNFSRVDLSASVISPLVWLFSATRKVWERERCILHRTHAAGTEWRCIAVFLAQLQRDVDIRLTDLARIRWHGTHIWLNGWTELLGVVTRLKWSFLLSVLHMSAVYRSCDIRTTDFYPNRIHQRCPTQFRQLFVACDPIQLFAVAW